MDTGELVKTNGRWKAIHPNRGPAHSIITAFTGPIRSGANFSRNGTSQETADLGSKALASLPINKPVLNPTATCCALHTVPESARISTVQYLFDAVENKAIWELFFTTCTNGYQQPCPNYCVHAISPTGGREILAASPDGCDLRPVDAYPKAYLYARIVKAKLFIDAHFPEPIDVEAISGEAAFSKFHFIREFRSIYGRTPREHLSNCRIERAKELLAEGAQVLDACLAVGFSSLSSFSRSFKQATGSTPAAFRDAALQRQKKESAQPLTFVPDCFSGAHGLKSE